MYNFQVADPQTNSMRRMIEEPKVGLLIKEASFANQQKQQTTTTAAMQPQQGSVNSGN